MVFFPPPPPLYDLFRPLPSAQTTRNRWSCKVPLYSDSPLVSLEKRLDSSLFFRGVPVGDMPPVAVPRNFAMGLPVVNVSTTTPKSEDFLRLLSPFFPFQEPCGPLHPLGGRLPHWRQHDRTNAPELGFFSLPSLHRPPFSKSFFFMSTSRPLLSPGRTYKDTLCSKTSLPPMAPGSLRIDPVPSLVFFGRETRDSLPGTLLGAVAVSSSTERSLDRNRFFLVFSFFLNASILGVNLPFRLFSFRVSPGQSLLVPFPSRRGDFEDHLKFFFDDLPPFSPAFDDDSQRLFGGSSIFWALSF